jgi:ABC-type dipeptide/oligopeptide/nickel transport system permease component
MIAYVGRRLLTALVTVWLVATAGFLLVELIPGDPARSLAGPSASVDAIERIREAYGFDDPLPERYLAAMVRILHGDLGTSISRAEPVTTVLARSLPPTLALTALAFLAELAIGIPLALWVVSRRSPWADRLLLGAAAATSAIPTFLVGLVMLYLFAFVLGWLPLGGARSPSAWVLPVLTLGLPFGLVLARLLRTSLLEQMDQPYVTFAAGMGDGPWSVRIRHVLPNALLPLLSVLALDLAGLFSAVAVVEIVFSMPGLGADLVQGLRRLDTALIVGVGIVAGLLVALANLVADLVVVAVDPRVRR